MISKREVGAFLVSTLVLTIVFGLKEGTVSLTPVYWFNNLLMIFFLSVILLGIYVCAQKYAAWRFDAFTEFQVWMVRRFKVAHQRYNPKKHSPIPIGILLAILLSLLSFGKIIFTGLWENTVGYYERKRVGRDKVRVTEFEIGKILFAGPAALVVFVIILQWLSKFGFNVGFVSSMAFLIALVNMLPLPGLDGSKIFFGSKFLWMFSFLFVILGFGLKYTGVISSIFLSVILAFILMGVYYYKVKG